MRRPPRSYTSAARRESPGSARNSESCLAGDPISAFSNVSLKKKRKKTARGPISKRVDLAADLWKYVGKLRVIERYSRQSDS